MIVVDTNVVAYFVIPGPRTKGAEAVRSRDHDWHVPALFVHEWLNVVTAYVRGRVFDRDEAVRHFHRGLSLVHVEATAPDPVRVINLHLATGCSSYD